LGKAGGGSGQIYGLVREKRKMVPKVFCIFYLTLSGLKTLKGFRTPSLFLTALRFSHSATACRSTKIPYFAQNIPACLP